MTIKRRGLGICVAAAFGGVTALAAELPTLDASLTYGPVPRSTLVSRPDLSFRAARLQRDGALITVLAYQRPDGTLEQVAVLSSSRAGSEARLSLQRLPRADSQADVEVATLEHLYVLALRQEPEARFCMADGEVSCDASRLGQSQSELLRALAAARASALERAAGANRSVPWRVVSMAPWAKQSTDPDEVGVRVSSDQGPIVGASVYFNRAPHSMCVGKSREDGAATCRLVDQHDDGGSHGEEARVPVVATYPGDVRDGRMLVPTTLVMQPAP